MIELAFNKVTRFIFALILAFLMLGLAIGAAKLVFDFTAILKTTTITGTYQHLISDVLSLFILIELSRSLVGYFEKNILQVNAILDAGIVFVLREIMIFLYEKKATESMLLSLAALLLVLGGLRIAWLVVDRNVEPPAAKST